jgi:hypothetical protein
VRGRRRLRYKSLTYLCMKGLSCVCSGSLASITCLRCEKKKQAMGERDGCEKKRKKKQAVGESERRLALRK